MSDIVLSTDSKNDYVKLQLDRTKKDFPKATKAQIEKLRPQAVAQANAFFSNNPYGYEADGSIYLPSETYIFNPTVGVVPETEYNIIGVGILGHENYHTKNGRDEPPAYKEELRLLNKFNPDAKLLYVNDRIGTVKKKAGVP